MSSKRSEMKKLYIMPLLTSMLTLSIICRKNDFDYRSDPYYQDNKSEQTQSRRYAAYVGPYSSYYHGSEFMEYDPFFDEHYHY